MHIVKEPNFTPLEKMKKGVDKLADAVKETLGAGGRNVIIEQENGLPIITKDGVTVAEHVVLSDSTENLGAELVKQAARQTAKIAGDGSSSTISIAQSIISNGLSVNEDLNKVEFARGIEAAAKAMADLVQKEAIEVKPEDLDLIATVSANGDKELGRLVAEAVRLSGLEGTINAEQSKTGRSYVERTNGMAINAPIFNTALLNEGSIAVAEKVYVLVSNKKMMRQAELVNVMRKVVEARASLLVINEYIEGEAMSFFTENSRAMKQHYNGAVICSRSGQLGHGYLRDQVLEDICAFTGATYIRDESGIMLEELELAHLGFVSKVVVDSRRTTLIEPNETEELVEERIKTVREQLNLNDGLEEFHKRRISSLKQGLATIYIAFLTEAEGGEKAYRLDDAIRACKSAMEQGYVAGGGIALPQIAYKNAESLIEIQEKLSPHAQKGFDTLMKSLSAPLACILSNAGIDVNVDDLIAGEYGYGIDVVSKEKVNMIEAGIIDPAKVSINAVANAASVACLFLTTSCSMVIADESKK